MTRRRDPTLEDLRCPHCKEPPLGVSPHKMNIHPPSLPALLADRTFTGISFWRGECPACGYGYAWRLAPGQPPLLADCWQLRPPAKKPHPSFPGIDEQEAAGVFRRRG
jgi:hypothetical protein